MQRPTTATTQLALWDTAISASRAPLGIFKRDFHQGLRHTINWVAIETDRAMAWDHLPEEKWAETFYATMARSLSTLIHRYNEPDKKKTLAAREHRARMRFFRRYSIINF